jgi:hypothetical protein
MNAEQIRAKILEGISSLGTARLNYLSGLNHISGVTVAAAENRITATRGDTEHISIAFEKLDSIATGLATGNPINVDAVFQGSGNARSALETILAHLPNIGFLPANKSPNTGPKKIVWFNDEIHPLGQVLDACELMRNRGVEGTGATALGEAEQMAGIAGQFEDAANLALLRVDQLAFQRLASSLLSKRFLIATGLAGSGKTKLAQAFTQWLTRGIDYYKVVPVGADWTGNENILGYANGLDPEKYFTKPALDLILHAKDHKDDPHFLILDEMNLSHVERYFADILSAIESDEKIHLHRDEKRTAGGTDIDPEIELPKNLFIIGTVNIDETTHMFSPKVLDRANVIEFRMKDAELASFLKNPAKPNLAELEGEGYEKFGRAFVLAAKNPAEVTEDAELRFQCEMLLFFKVLQKHGAEFGFRVAHEAGRFVHFYKKIGVETDVEIWFKDAFDCIIVQKFLPKLHGSETKLRGVLFSLAHLCANKREWTGATLKDNEELIDKISIEAKTKADSSVNSPTQVLAKVLDGKVENSHYPLSFEKIERMWRAANENGFASFAES